MAEFAALRTILLNVLLKQANGESLTAEQMQSPREVVTDIMIMGSNRGVGSDTNKYSCEAMMHFGGRILECPSRVARI
jgi:hypothetical protein